MVNAGSTSLKVELFSLPDERSLASGEVQRIGSSEASVSWRRADATFGQEGAAQTSDSLARPIENHEQGLRVLIEVLSLASKIPDAVAHRVVHGGEALTTTTLIDAKVEEQIATCSRFAPLHNPANLSGIQACRRLFPSLPQVAVMDTAFHQSLEPEAYLYALPYDLYEQHGIRRYGFHGTSHRFVADETARLLGRDVKDLRLVTCHLGGGASVCAIRGGRSIATSMGMTPLEGLVMGTRSGDVDPSVVLHLQESLGLSTVAVAELLNRESGLKGVSGVSRDMRELLAAADRGHERAALAVRMFCRRLRQYIGAYMADLGGLDGLVFTGGIGENAATIREQTLAGLEGLGLELDEERNQRDEHQPRIVSPPEASPVVAVVPTDEELQIARETAVLLEAAPRA